MQAPCSLQPCLQTFRTSGIALTLGAAPWLAEAALVSVMLGLVMKLPVWLAILGGCLLAATGPCSLTVGMAELQRQGYGAQSGQAPPFLASQCIALKGHPMLTHVSYKQWHEQQPFEPVSILLALQGNLLGAVHDMLCLADARRCAVTCQS